MSMFHLRILFFSLFFQATQSTVEDPNTKESPSSPGPVNVVITPDLRAQLMSPVTPLSEGDQQVAAENSEDQDGPQTMSEV